MEKFINQDEQPQQSFQTCPPPSNPTTPPLKSNPPPFLHNRKSEEDDAYVNSLPPGYKFAPDDDELIVHYLNRKILNLPLPPNKIIDVNIYQHNPEHLAERFEHYGCKVKEKKWYFFTPRNRKYRNGSRPNRAADGGHWKATGADKEVKHKGKIVGYRKALVFYFGKPSEGQKTNWIMHEFRVSDPPKPKINDMKLDDWVLCSIHEVKRGAALEKRRQEDSVCNMEDDIEICFDSDNNLILPPPKDDQPSFPEPHNPISPNSDNNLMLPPSNDDRPSFPEPHNPISPNSSFNPFNFSSNQFVEGIDDQLGYGGNLIMPNSALIPLHMINPTFETPFQSHNVVHQEVMYGGSFDEFDPSSLINNPVPGVPASSFTSSENPLLQPISTVQCYNSLAQSISISQSFDTFLVQPSVDKDETSVQNFKY